jgi:hypothetical protein
MSGRRVKQAATVNSAAAAATAAKRAASAARSAGSMALEDAAAEVEAAEGAARAEPPVPRPKAPPSKAAPAQPAEPTDRQKTLEAAKEKEINKALNDTVRKLQEQLNQAEMEKKQLKEAQKAKGGRRASQEPKPTKTNAQRRHEKVFVATDHTHHYIHSFRQSGTPAV